MKNKIDEKIISLPEIDEDRFFKYLESLIDVKKFNNIREWMDRKGYIEIEKYKQSIKKKTKKVQTNLF